MAKAKFDRGDVVDQSLKLFWKNGFSGSSMQQVVDATGLKPGSIYFSFGSKEALFLEALGRYAEKSFELIHDLMTVSTSVGEAICAFFEARLNETTRGQYRSCFLIKTQLELGAEQNALYDYAIEKLNEIENIFQQYLEPEYGAALSKQRAVSIMLHLNGLRVYGYRNDTVEHMRSGLRTGMPWLPWA